MKYPYLKEKANQAIFVGNYMECYIPQDTFDKGISYFVGDILNTVGLFNLRVNMTANADITKQKLHTFNAPSMITMKPSSTEKKTLALIPGKPEVAYTVLKFFNGDAVLTTLDAIQSVDNTDLFMMKMLTLGKLPDTLTYNDGFKSYLKNLEMNKINLDTPAPTLSVIYSEIYRYNKDVGIPFRQAYGKGLCGPYDYTTANMRTIASLTSTFSAMTFEDIDNMVIRSVNRKRYNSKNAESPIENLLK